MYSQKTVVKLMLAMKQHMEKYVISLVVFSYVVICRVLELCINIYNYANYERSRLSNSLPYTGLNYDIVVL